VTGKRKKPASHTATARAASQPSTETTERGMSEVDRFLIDTAAQSEAADGAQGIAPAELSFPEIDPLATYWTELDLFCKKCAITHYVAFCTMLNAAESPHLVERARANQFNYKRCPICHTIEYVEHPWTFYDPARRLLVQVRPAWEWHAGGGEEWYAARLEDLFDRWAEHDVRIDVVFGPEQLIERYLQEGE